MSIVEQAREGQAYVGQALRRKEDPPLITGQGSYVDDIKLAGELHMALVRSPEAHARVTAIDTSEALAAPGVCAVYTAADLEGDILAPLPMVWAPPGVEVNNPPHWSLAKDEVNCVGDPVAVVIGDDRGRVVDAAELVIVDYEPLDVVVDPERTLEDGAPLVHAELGTNRCMRWSLGGGDLEAAWREADVVVERRIVNHRMAAAPIEPRACIAEWRGAELTLWSTTQVPHILRFAGSQLLGTQEDRMRVIAPDVGGGFGGKLNVYAEEMLVCACARKLRRPVRWTETRSEHMTTTAHGRDQVDHCKMGGKRDGTITGLHCEVIADLGAYLQILTPAIPALGAFVMSGCYKIPAVQTDITGVFTNKFSTDAVRGAGRPEATHMVETMVTQAAAEIGMDPLEIRRRNFIPKEDFPNAPTAVVVAYDSGDYDASLDKLLEHVDVEGFRAEQARLVEQGIYRGIGFSTYTEICGLAPSRVVGPSGFGMQAGFWESAEVRVHPTGSVTVFTGTSPHGQGLDTSFAQIVADRLGVSPDLVDVIHGDTSTGPHGMGTYGSRSLAVGGESIVRATTKVVDKAKRIVAHQLEAAPEDIEVTGGAFQVRGSPDKRMALAEVAGAAYIPEDLPEGLEPGLSEGNFYDPENFVFPFGAHACIVDVDAETGKVRVLRWVAVDDCGPAINPLLIDGQVHGGIVHGIGQALYEQVVYDETGQLTTGSFVDYALATAAEVPSFETDRTETPSPVNALGVKGVGEAGTIAASPAVLAAVTDALRPFGVTFMNMPLTPMRVWQTIQEARGADGGPAATEQGRDVGPHGQGSAGSGPAQPREEGRS